MNILWTYNGLTRARKWDSELRSREGGGAESASCQLSSYEG